jgi:hypothetical protein
MRATYLELDGAGEVFMMTRPPGPRMHAFLPSIITYGDLVFGTSLVREANR